MFYYSDAEPYSRHLARVVTCLPRYFPPDVVFAQASYKLRMVDYRVILIRDTFLSLAEQNTILHRNLPKADIALTIEGITNKSAVKLMKNPSPISCIQRYHQCWLTSVISNSLLNTVDI